MHPVLAAAQPTEGPPDTAHRAVAAHAAAPGHAAPDTRAPSQPAASAVRDHVRRRDALRVDTSARISARARLHHTPAHPGALPSWQPTRSLNENDMRERVRLHFGAPLA